MVKKASSATSIARSRRAGRCRLRGAEPTTPIENPSAELTDAVLEQRLFARAGVKRGFRRRVEPDWAALACELKRPGVNLMVLWEEYRDGSSGRLRLQPVLRSVPRVRAAPLAGDAPGPSGRRQGVRRLLRQEDRHRRSRHRRRARGGDLRRRAGRLELHLCRGDLDPDAAGLDRRPCPHVPLLRRRAAPGRAGQSEVRRPQGLVLRPGDQPQLRHDGRPLRRRHPAGAAAQAPRQGQGRGRRPLRPELHPRAGSGGRPSSRWPRPTRPSPPSSSASTTMSCAGSASAAGICSRPSSGRRWRRCRTTDYEFAEWRLARVSLDYHVEIDGFFYSVPHGLIREQVDIRADRPHRSRSSTAASASPLTSAATAAAGTAPIPTTCRAPHRRYAEWTPDRFRRWGALDRAQHRGARHRHPGQPAASRTGLPHLPRRAAAVQGSRSGTGRDWSRPAPSRSVRSPTRASPPSSPTSSIARPPPPSRRR